MPLVMPLLPRGECHALPLPRTLPRQLYSAQTERADGALGPLVPSADHHNGGPLTIKKVSVESTASLRGVPGMSSTARRVTIMGSSSSARGTLAVGKTAELSALLSLLAHIGPVRFVSLPKRIPGQYIAEFGPAPVDPIQAAVPDQVTTAVERARAARSFLRRLSTSNARSPASTASSLSPPRYQAIPHPRGER